jgi:mannosidase alpha-like ER degradation enhancer 1
VPKSKPTEIASLSLLTGDPVYEIAAMRAMNSLWQRRSEINLIGNNINVALTCLNAIIGSGVDSYFEFLVKAANPELPDNPELINQFQVYKK